MTQTRIVLLCADDDEQHLRRLREALQRLGGEVASVEAFRNGARLRGRAAELAHQGVPIPVVFVDESLNDGHGVDALIALVGDEGLAATRKVLLTGGKEPEATARAVRARALDSALTKPWTEEQLSTTLDRLVTQYFLEQEPEALERVPDLVDVEVLSHAFAIAGEREREAVERLEDLQRSFLGDRSLDDDEVEEAMIAEIDRVLAHPPRERFPAGSMLLRSGDPVDGVMIVLEGTVRLTLDVEGEEVVFHARTAGRIVGLLALARTQPAYFNVQASTDVVVLPVSLDQLDEALRRSSTLAVHFASVLVRSLARRNLRSVELQLERDRLARDLAAERDQLAATLELLTEAQARLVESDRMATLGRLVAGIGHELNNPVTAILRSAEFLSGDVARLAERAGEQRLLEEALGHRPHSTKEERSRRRALAEVIGDDALADRLVELGIEEASEYEQRIGSLKPTQREAALATLEMYHRVASALRNIRSSAERVAGLVRGLRSYARVNHEERRDVDVHEGLEESVLLLGHELHDVEVMRDYAELPVIRGFPGALNQVWTNLIVNAVQAMEGEGTLTLTTSLTDDSVVVEVGDTGPGIPPDDLERIFDMHYTTKHGRVEFGLGIGLRIALDVVERHGGSIEVASRPGDTRFVVTLPIREEEG